MPKKNKNRKTPFQPKPQHPNLSHKTEPVELTAVVNEPAGFVADEYQEYQLLKNIIVKDNEEVLIDVEKYRLAKMEEVEREIADTRKNIADECEEMLKNQMDNIEKEVKKKKKELEESNQTLGKEYAALLEKKNKLDNEINKKIQDAETTAEKLIATAEEDAEEKKKKVEDRNKELNSREESFKLKEEDLNLELELLQESKNQLRKLKETCSPDALARLEAELQGERLIRERLSNLLEQVQAENAELKTIQYATFGKDIDVIVNENESLKQEVRRLSDQQLAMPSIQEIELLKKAQEERNNLIQENASLVKKLQEKEAEILRFNINTMELEQLKAQLDALYVLNNHLKDELINSKKVLESRTGEVCPILSNEDRHANDIKTKQSLATRFSLQQKNLTLGKLATHIQTYAAGKGLTYGIKDISAFLAGMASSRLMILQGLSGTGKTSLPRIFMEAISGECSIVPVASSWRDRNELLGYYNDFYKKFNATDFTANVYRAGLNGYKDIPTVIVLDEMNLSRVEYYFADFLSVLESPYPDDWKIALTSNDMRSLPAKIDISSGLFDHSDQTMLDIRNSLYNKIGGKIQDSQVSDEERETYIRYLSSDNNTRVYISGPKNIEDGRKLIVTPNVWFVGTANKDESTFEISDKVYDRAQIINRNKREKTSPKSDVKPVFIPIDQINAMFEESKKKLGFKADDDELISSIEESSKELLDVTFGNRILLQMDNFIPVFAEAGGGNVSEAIDYQFATKVLRKIEFKQIKADNLKLFKEFAQSKALKMSADVIEEKIQSES